MTLIQKPYAVYENVNGVGFCSIVNLWLLYNDNMFGASWFKLPLWLGQNRLERDGHVFEPQSGLESRALSKSETNRQAASSTSTKYNHNILRSVNLGLIGGI